MVYTFHLDPPFRRRAVRRVQHPGAARTRGPRASNRPSDAAECRLRAAASFRFRLFGLRLGCGLARRNELGREEDTQVAEGIECVVFFLFFVLIPDVCVHQRSESGLDVYLIICLGIWDAIGLPTICTILQLQYTIY
jgi:hypothetical protein